MQLLNELGSAIENEWRALDYHEPKFPGLAAEALRRARLLEQIRPEDVLAWTLGERRLPVQKDPTSRFGDPPITIFVAPRFYIDVYFWFEGTTSIHQHGFFGAFQVLAGASIHSHYDFECREKINAFIEYGRLRLRKCELLETGSVREITAGRGYIHSLFHLDQPSVTIVVRTDASPMHLPQFDYQKPHIAVDPFYTDETFAKKMQALTAMLRLNEERARAEIETMLETEDFQSTFQLLSALFNHERPNRLDEFFNVSDRGSSRFASYLDAAVKRHGEKAEALKRVFDERETRMRIIACRRGTTQPEHRFFLALLLNIEGHEQIFSLIKSRFPDADPLEKALDWISELARTRTVGADGANLLQIPDFDDLDVAILEELLRGGDAASLAESLLKQGAALSAEHLGLRIEKLQSSRVLRPLFAA